MYTQAVDGLVDKETFLCTQKQWMGFWIRRHF